MSFDNINVAGLPLEHNALNSMNIALNDYFVAQRLINIPIWQYFKSLKTTSEALFAELVMISYKCNAGKKNSQVRMQYTKGKSSILGG